MTLRRKPPRDNVRRVAPIGGNLRYTITSKTDQTVQCESLQERKLTLCFDRDPSIQTYMSQPERFTYYDQQGKEHTYTPDFMVWKVTGEIEIHEVTLTERAAERRMQERTQAAQAICQKRGWRYIVHTEATLPQATEEANLLALARYRPTAYANPDVTHAVQTQLADGRSSVFFTHLSPKWSRPSTCLRALLSLPSAIFSGMGRLKPICVITSFSRMLRRHLVCWFGRDARRMPDESQAFATNPFPFRNRTPFVASSPAWSLPVLAATDLPHHRT